MYVLAPHVHIMKNKPNEPTYAKNFGWDINGLNDLYFVQ